mmetsp:Transcript_119223/g.218466  ORF Transcript_119223/g.218466 Transcript_119223/m.218466 type:complete len:101 (-) Transcript_119223:955-1257(-)
MRRRRMRRKGKAGAEAPPAAEGVVAEGGVATTRTKTAAGTIRAAVETADAALRTSTGVTAAARAAAAVGVPAAGGTGVQKRRRRQQSSQQVAHQPLQRDF